MTRLKEAADGWVAERRGEGERGQGRVAGGEKGGQGREEEGRGGKKRAEGERVRAYARVPPPATALGLLSPADPPGAIRHLHSSNAPPASSATAGKDTRLLTR